MKRINCLDHCPFYNPGRGACRAATIEKPLDSTIETKRCLSEDFDDCTLFLCRLLRGSPPRKASRRRSITLR